MLHKILLCLFAARVVYSFGAGNVPSHGHLEGKAVRHGDIDDVLEELSKGSGLLNSHFSERDIRKIYFGSWLRDFSQAIDTASLKMLDESVIRSLIAVMGFLKFGYGTGAFAVTPERLGCYRPEEHLDNPKGYPDDAKGYSQCLRGPVSMAEYSISNDGMKSYLTSARNHDVPRLVRDVVETHRSGNIDEAYIKLGKLLHLLEDFFAHSNFVELALREYGNDVFPFVNRNSPQSIFGKSAFPLVTGTFGSKDFVVSMLKEIQDTLTQSVPWHVDNQEFRNFVENRDYQRGQAEKILKKLFVIHDTIKRPLSMAAKAVGLAQATEWTMSMFRRAALHSLKPVLEPVVASVVRLLENQVGMIMQAPEQNLVFHEYGNTDPTHSQLSKDHLDHPLNPLAGELSKHMALIVTSKIVRAWKSGSSVHLEDAVLAAQNCIFHPASVPMSYSSRIDDRSTPSSQTPSYFQQHQQHHPHHRYDYPQSSFGNPQSYDYSQSFGHPPPNAHAPNHHSTSYPNPYNTQFGNPSYQYPAQYPQPNPYQQNPYTQSGGYPPVGGSGFYPTLRKRGWGDEDVKEGQRGLFGRRKSKWADISSQEIPSKLMEIVGNWARGNHHVISRLSEEHWTAQSDYGIARQHQEYRSARGAS